VNFFSNNPDVLVSEDNSCRGLNVWTVEHSALLLSDHLNHFVNGSRSNLRLSGLSGLNELGLSSSVQHSVVLVDLAHVEKVSPSEGKESIS
jgi:hypothetical protein